jgi:hypothetical protein
MAFLTMLALSGASRASANPLPERQLLSDGAPIPQIPRDNWKDCSFNDRLIGCQDRELADGVRIDWRDGRSMTYRLIRAGFPLSLLRDRYGGLWQREILGQGNAVYTKVLLDEDAPGKAFSGKTVAGKTLPGQTAPGKTAPGKAVPGKPSLGKPVLGKPAQSNRIVVPLRLPCKPPLVGEVGYCQRP